MLTMRNWMFIKQYAGLREHLFSTHGLRALGYFDRGAFEDVLDEVVSVAVSVVAKRARESHSVAVCPTPRDDRSRDNERTQRKRAATLCHIGRHEFDPVSLKVVPEWPLVYWWTSHRLNRIQGITLDDVTVMKNGMQTSDNLRFLRYHWELDRCAFPVRAKDTARTSSWVPYVKGADGASWRAPVIDCIQWARNGLEVKQFNEWVYGSFSRKVYSEEWFFRRAMAFAGKGMNFSARRYDFEAIFDIEGRSVFTESSSAILCALNSRETREIAIDLNPTVHTTIGDVKRCPLVQVPEHDEIVRRVDHSFAEYESGRESSLEFRGPGPSSWEATKHWAWCAVDRGPAEALPSTTQEPDLPAPQAHLSFALGIAVGRFGARSPDGHGEGILDPAAHDLSRAFPSGILFLDTTLYAEDQRDSLGHPAAAPLHDAWKLHGPAIAPKRNLRDWLALDFFKDVHKGMYENRPIHWPLSSEKKTFVAWVNIHRMDERTLVVLLADHLHPALNRIEGELTDLRQARDGADRRAAREAEKRYDKLLKARDELALFIADVEQCADKGPLPPDNQCPPREQDARYAPDLDDGVMINSAALWKLLESQWKEPKKWWKELATASGKKAYDWAHLAMRYWPTRVDDKCQNDPSLGVAHGCFWRYHPERAWAWELRLQDEIGIEPVEGSSWKGRIEEPPYRPGGRDLGDEGDGPHRAAWLRDHAPDALAAVEREALRRMRRGKVRKVVPELRILERGLWSALPSEVWAMELRLSEKQGAEFRLRSPDEADARTAFEATHPELVRARRQLLETLSPDCQLFDEGGSDENGDEIVEEEGELAEEDVS